MRRKELALVLLITLSAACGCVQLGPVYRKESQQFSLRPPRGWRHIDAPPIEQTTMFQSHHVRGHKFRPELTVEVYQTEIETVEELMEEFTEEAQALQEYELEREDAVGLFDGRRLVYTYYDPDYRLLFTAATQLMLGEGRVYKATYRAPKSLWKDYEDMFYYSLDTFKLEGG